MHLRLNFSIDILLLTHILKKVGADIKCFGMCDCTVLIIENAQNFCSSDRKIVAGGCCCTVQIVYVAPMKALAAEMVRNFGQRLAALGITVQELTGDMQLSKSEIMKTQVQFCGGILFPFSALTLVIRCLVPVGATVHERISPQQSLVIVIVRHL